MAESCGFGEPDRCLGHTEPATLGGNICNASPAADNAPALLVYDADLEINGRREHVACLTKSSILAIGEWHYRTENS